MPGFDATVGRNLKQYREARGLTQTELAEVVSRFGETSFAQQTIVKIEKGSRPLKLREAERLAAALEIGLDDLVDDSEVMVSRAALIIEATRKLWDASAAVHDSVSRMNDAKAWLEAQLEPYRDSQEMRDVVAAAVLDDAESALQLDAVAIAQDPSAPPGVRMISFAPRTQEGEGLPTLAEVRASRRGKVATPMGNAARPDEGK